MQTENPIADLMMLKKAQRDLIAACGGLVAASQMCRVGKTTLQKYGDPAHADTHMPIDVAHELQHACGQHIAGRVLSEPAASRSDNVQFEDHLLKSIAEFGEVAVAISEMNADGVQTPRELRRVAEEAEDAIRILQEIRDAANGRLPSPLRSAS